MKILIEQIIAPAISSDEELFDIARARIKKTRALNCFGEMYIYKRSIDARHKECIKQVCTVCADVEYASSQEPIDLLKYGIKIFSEEIVEFTYTGDIPQTPPLVVGFGPCGMFCALGLARAGLKPIVIERGADVDTRVKCVEDFYSSKKLSLDTNIQFGAGGAGTFSDGKLTTGINDPKCAYVLKTLCEFGAPQEILYQAKPHIGTDLLRGIIKNIAAGKVPVLVCFEKDGFCHRHLIAEWFNSHDIECQEWTKPVVNTNTFSVAAMTTAAAVTGVNF